MPRAISQIQSTGRMAPIFRILAMAKDSTDFVIKCYENAELLLGFMYLSTANALIKTVEERRSRLRI